MRYLFICTEQVGVHSLSAMAMLIPANLFLGVALTPPPTSEYHARIKNVCKCQSCMVFWTALLISRRGVRNSSASSSCPSSPSAAGCCCCCCCCHGLHATCRLRRAVRLASRRAAMTSRDHGGLVADRGLLLVLPPTRGGKSPLDKVILYARSPSHGPTFLPWPR